MFLEVLDKGTASNAGGAASVGPGGLRGGKVVLPDLLLCCICWVLGEYGGLASQLPPPHRVNSGQVCRDRGTAARLFCGLNGQNRAGLWQQGMSQHNMGRQMEACVLCFCVSFRGGRECKCSMTAVACPCWVSCTTLLHDMSDKRHGAS